MQCPKCQTEMVTHDVDGVDIDRCGVCGGMWFDLGEEEQLLKSNSDAAKDLDLGETSRTEANKLIRDIDCPRCHTRLMKLAHHEQRHIEYEMCGTCGGVYLDSGEFDDLRELSLAERIRKLFPNLLGTRKTEED